MQSDHRSVALSSIDSGSGFFADHPLLMLSHSANDLCVSLQVRTQDEGKPRAKMTKAREYQHAQTKR